MPKILRLVAALFVFLASCHGAMAQVNGALQYDITNWYWIANNTNPTTQVFSSASGTYVANNNATYLSWLANGTANAQAITGAANNGSGLVRLAVGNTGNYQTGQYWNVGGTGLYDQNWKITVIDATHIDLQASTYTSTVTAGFVSGATVVGTAAEIYVTIDNYNQLLRQRPGYAVNTSATLTNPTPAVVDQTAGATVALPQADIPGAMQLGRPFIFWNDQGSPIAITDFSGGALLTLGPNEVLSIVMTSNSSVAGTWKWGYLPPADPSNASSLLIGTVNPARLPTPTASTLGGVQSKAAVAHNFLTQIGTDGSVSQAQPSIGDISGLGTGVATALGNNANATGGPVTAATGCTAFTPTDQSGGSIGSFTSVSVQYCQYGNLVTVYGTLTYPSTADTHNATISLPVAAPNQNYAAAPGVLIDRFGNGDFLLPVANSSTAIVVVGSTGAQRTNANLSLKQLNLNLTYPAN